MKGGKAKTKQNKKTAKKERRVTVRDRESKRVREQASERERERESVCEREKTVREESQSREQMKVKKIRYARSFVIKSPPNLLIPPHLQPPPPNPARLQFPRHRQKIPLSISGHYLRIFMVASRPPSCPWMDTVFHLYLRVAPNDYHAG